MSLRAERYCALSSVVGTAIMLLKTGPFTYGGLLGFYVPLGVFVIWLLGMPYAIVQDLRREGRETHEPSDVAPARS